MRILCIASHPDDEILGVGGTLLRHKEAGDEVFIYIAGPCARPGAVSDDEMIEACRRMDIAYLPGWSPRSEVTRSIEDTVTDLRPHTVYTHSRADLHQDHQDAVYRTLVACRPQSGVRALYAFETPSATDWSGVPFLPSRFVDIRDVIEQKMEVMEAYASELRERPHPRNIDALYDRALYWGQRAGIEYAEAFEVIREVW